MNQFVQRYIQIRSGSAIIYEKYIGDRKNKSLEEAKKRLAEAEKYTGCVTEGASKRITKAITLLIDSSITQQILNPVTNRRFNFKLSFMTLTIPDTKKISIKESHALLLEPLLKWLRQTQGMKNYVWKMELQKRGVIHWHLTSDCFVVHSELRNKWNKLLSRAGMNEDFVKVQGHTNANSTDIHSVKNIKNLGAYLIKYFTKKEQNNNTMAGKIWDCSKNLKKARYYETELTEDIDIMIDERITKGELGVYVGERFQILKPKNFSILSLFPPEVRDAYYLNLQNIRELEPDLFNCFINRTPKQDTVPITVQNNIVPTFTNHQSILPFFGLSLI